MPTFYFELQKPTDVVTDEEGQDLPTIEHARQEAIASAKELIILAIRGDRAVGVSTVRMLDERGQVVASVDLIDVLPADLRPTR
jgi:hypothetical protein